MLRAAKYCTVFGPVGTRYDTVVSDRPMAALNPVSSCTSRAAVTCGTSPTSALPLGSDQSSYRGRCTSATRTPYRRDGRHSTAPAARMTVPDPSVGAGLIPPGVASAQQLLLDVLAGPVRGRLRPTVRTQHPAAGVRSGDHVEQCRHPVGGRLVLDLDEGLDPPIEVAVHHVRAADPVLLLAGRQFRRIGMVGPLVGAEIGLSRRFHRGAVPVAEVEDPRVLQEAPDNRADGDVLAQPGHTGPQRADPADRQVDGDAGS